MSKDASALEIRLLGTPQVLVNGHDLKVLRRKNRALIYYLAAQDRQLTRETLLTFFWPDHERTTALPILRTMIHDLRKYLGESFRADDKVITLSSDTHIDLPDFSSAVTSPSSNLNTLADALDLYRGDFLEGFSLADATQFDDWVNSERERCQILAMNGFARLAHFHEIQGNYPIALESIYRALAFNPFQEDIQRDVMRLLYLNGNRVGVVRQYESLRKLLDEELGVPPMLETRELYDSIIKDTFIRHPLMPTGQLTFTNRSIENDFLPFIGRDTELETLTRQLNSGKLIILEGEPGIGKTRLATEFMASQTRGRKSALVLQGKSYELEQTLPYLPIVEALRKLMARPDCKDLFSQLNLDAVWLSELARLLPEILTRYPDIPTPGQNVEVLRLWESLVQLFRGLSNLREVWLFLDDLHWADAATIDWLGYLLRNIKSPSLVLLSTAQPNEGQNHFVRFLQTFKREDSLVEIPVSVLPEAAMKKIASTMSKTDAGKLSDWLINNTEGNPFFIKELLLYAIRIGMLKEDGVLDRELLQVTPSIPATIQNLVESRLLKLSENARQVLHLSAIIGREFDFELIKNISSFSESDTLNAIEELLSAHLIIPLPDEKYSFDHYFTMQESLNNMNEARRHFLHRHVAEVLETIYKADLDPVSGLIAHHFMSANLPDRAKTYAFRAGRFAANLAAWIEAIAFYKQALELETIDIERAHIYLAMGVAYFHKGDFILASKQYQFAVEWAQACHEWALLEEAYLGLSLSLYPQARFTEAIADAKELRASGPPELAICAEFIWGASLNVESAHPLEAEHHLHIAEQLLHEQKGPFVSKVSSAEIKYSLAGTYGQQGRIRDAVEQYLEVLNLIEVGKGRLDTLRHIMLFNNLAYYLHLLGDASAKIYVEKGIKLARERGSLSHLPYLYSTSGEISLTNGDVDSAEKYFNEGFILAKQIPIPERIAGMTANLGLVAKRRGDIARAREQLQTALDLVEPLGNHHLEVRIRIWLAPFLPQTDARACLSSARILAEHDGLQGLLEEIAELENQL